MSLIKLQGNASGTGAFTIAAPNSNTDRTLTLPDAAGEVFTQGNIVGTVSQSGGVPTGEIFETGSNANGEYYKYADGRLEVRCVACTFSAPTVGTYAGGTVDSYTVSIVYPHVFSVTPEHFALCLSEGSNTNPSNGALFTKNYNETGITLLRAGRGATTERTHEGRDVLVTAFGRWF